jgi:hypothetical protein
VERCLANSVIGFRSPGDVDGGIKLARGTTIQDLFAMRVQRELRDRPYAVVVDLPDAFGNLPHRWSSRRSRRWGSPAAMPASSATS